MKHVFTLLLSLAFWGGWQTHVQAQKYTADFSTAPTIDYGGGQTYYKTKLTVKIGGIDYFIDNAINADFVYHGDKQNVSYDPYSGVGLLLKRVDGKPFSFYGIDLNYTSVNTDLAQAPWLTVTYAGENGNAAPVDSYNETSKNFSVSKPNGVTVSYVQLFFADLATLVLDNIIVGPASNTPACTNPTLPIISATKTAICAGSNTTLSIQSGSLNDATDWKWYSGSCGGTLAGTGSSIQVSPGSTTTYYVRGEGGCVTPGSCASQQITVSAPFTVALANNGPLTCAKTSVLLTTTGGPAGATYTYSSGAMAGSASSTTATVSQASPYSVTVAVPGGCSATATTLVSSNTVAPTLSINPTSQTICQGQSVNFVAQGASTYRWSTGDITASISVSVAGPYSVTGTSTSNGCSATATARLTVTPLPNANFTGLPPSVCVDAGAVTLTPTISGGTFSGPGISGNQFNPATATAGGPYSVTYTVSSQGCPNTSIQMVTVNALPIVTVTPAAVTICAGQSTTLTASGANTYKWTTGATTAAISVSTMAPYSVTGTSTSTGCSNTATANVMVTPLFNASFSGLPASVCVDAGAITLTPTTAGGLFSGTGITGNQFSPATATVGGPYSITYTVINQGCPNSSVQTVTVNPLPVAPTIATQSGHAYSGGVSSLTISQNVGNVILMTSGCPGGTITWAGGSSNTLAVSTFDAGVQTFTAICTNTNTGCTSTKATATVTVVGTTLSVLHRDGNGQVNTNTLAPYLELQNDGNSAIPYSEITVRYWLTVENPAPLLFSINYAQIGNDKVHLKYMPATTSNPKATGYVEFSFDASAGNLAAMSNSGAIQDLINKQDYSSFDQSNDYSYAPTSNFTPNERITAYRNGVLFYGREPGPVVAMQSVKAMLQNNTGADANSIEAVLSVTNDGDLPINYSDLKVRYYFTADNAQPLVLSQVGYTALGSGNVTGQLVSINPPLVKADTYLELSFSSSLGQLAPGASTGGITYQIRHADYSGFNQNNDYSYQGTGGMMLNPHVVVFVAGKRAYGTEPTSGARQGVEDTGKLTVQVLGNPVEGSAVEVMVSGAEGQTLTLQLTDLTGRSVLTRQVERAGTAESQRLEVGNASAGMMFLRVSTPTQSQTVKILRQQ